MWSGGENIFWGKKSKFYLFLMFFIKLEHFENLKHSGIFWKNPNLVILGEILKNFDETFFYIYCLCVCH